MMLTRYIGRIVILMIALSPPSQAQVQQSEVEHDRYDWNQDDYLKVQDTDSDFTQDYNKLLHLSIGVGTIENNNVGIGFRTIQGLYITVSGGSTDLPDEERWFGKSVGYFVKGGVCWRASTDALTPVVEMVFGRVRLDVQESTEIVTVPNRADIGSLLGGIEYRYDSGFNLGGRAGLRYSKIATKETKYLIGFQITAGWNF